MNDPDRVCCEHMENEKQQPRAYHRFFQLGEKRWLLLCEQCGLAIQGAILADVISNGVKEYMKNERKARG